MEFRFQDPAADFCDALDVIRRYHDSLIVHGRKLLELVGKIDSRGVNRELTHELAELYAYYRSANFLHHQDEERALFPQVVGRELLIDGMIERLTLDHSEIEEAWQVLEIAIREILEQHRLPEKLTLKAARFEKLQREHLVRENEDFLPQAEALLDAGQRRQVGAAMSRMRGLRA